MKKILYLHHEPINSQKANLIQVISMCKAMATEGFRVTLSLPEGGNGADLEFNELSFNVNIRKKKSKYERLDKYLNISSVKSTIKNVIPDTLYLRNPLLLRHSLSCDIPIIYELHHKKLHNRFELLNSYWRRLLIKNVLNGKIKRVVCISQALSNYWINQGIPSSKVLTAHDGIDVEMFSDPISKSEARGKLNLSINQKIVSYVGRLYSDRKIEDIIKLASIVKDAIFIIVGGPEDNKLYYQSLAQKEGVKNIKFIGQVEHHEVPLYLYASDVLLALWSSKVPTIRYCSPLKLFEYMGAERIIVAHNFPTIREVLTHGENSLLVEPSSFSDLERQTRTAINSKENDKIAINARNLVFEQFTWASRVEKIFEF